MTMYFRLLLITALLFCSGMLAAQTIKIATLAPDGSPWMKELRAAAHTVQQGSGGRVQIKFYPGGVMGNDAVVLRKMRLGQLQGGVLTGSELSLVYKDAQTYSLPFLFQSWAQVDKVRAEVDPILIEGFAKSGIHVLGVTGVGFAYLMSTQPIGNRDELKTRKVWVPQNDYIAEVTFAAGGVSPIPLPLSDVFTSLQTGLVNTVGNTPSGAVVLQWHGKLKYMVDLPLSYVIGYFVLDEKVWKKLAAADQKIVGEAFAAAAQRIDAANRKDDAAALQAMKRQGLSVRVPDAAEAARWREVGARAQAQLEAEGAVSPEVMAAIRAALGAAPSTAR